MQDHRSQEITVEAEDFEFQREAVSSMKTWETSSCPNERSAGRGVRLFSVILLCINSSFPWWILG